MILKSGYPFSYKKIKIISLICIISNSVKHSKSDIFYKLKKKDYLPIIRSRDNNFFQKITVALVFKIKIISVWQFVKEELNLLLKKSFAKC